MNNKIIDVLYQARLEEMSKLDKTDFIVMENNTNQKSQNESELEDCLSKIENEDIRNTLRELISEKMEIEEEIFSYIKEKFYKYGFSDAKDLLLKND